ncbi:hypothetical protein, unlikely [Trypanosoma brucei gambiense DAL972]|uniref:Uncharacterized protein n=1 Tax=Trypanosoma brucei gambiense (strain MHOM/CI/86/DAL972) TaxID=679716 RepID=C9ZKE0_TRYB9|nr:hypothetical protein, unlikely [Trypanosoma brucei gambiense DAL972]CBH09904.1 hypothetical protein, unlikely [Trypanosoma brucei gambiense DAL972]|eukprot:XP_011772197.1 hypothetical protein, unlikely [Trypanosoma brucei gambiense DAL972]
MYIYIMHYTLFVLYAYYYFYYLLRCTNKYEGSKVLTVVVTDGSHTQTHTVALHPCFMFPFFTLLFFSCSAPGVCRQSTWNEKCRWKGGKKRKQMKEETNQFHSVNKETSIYPFSGSDCKKKIIIINE